MSYFVADEDTEEFAAKDSIIPNPRETEIEASTFEAIFGMLFPAELAAAGYFIPGPYAMWFVFAVLMTLTMGAVVPATGKAKESERKGIPTKMVMQAGKYVFEWQTRVFPPRPLILPEVSEDQRTRKSAFLLDEVTHNIDEKGITIIDEAGEMIVNGQWFSPEDVDKMVADMVAEKEFDKDEEGLRVRKSRGFTDALGRLGERLRKMKGWIGVAIFAAITFYVFQHWLIYLWNSVLAPWLGWAPGVIP